MTFGEVVAIVVGTVGVVWLVTSAIRTVVMPRPERVWLTRTSFEIARRASRAVARRVVDPIRHHRVRRRSMYRTCRGAQPMRS